MAYHFFTFSCAALSTNVFEIPVPYDCTLQGASWVSNTDPSTDKSVSIAKVRGNPIITGDIDGTPGVVVKGDLTDTVADKNQVLTKTAGLELTIETTAKLELGLWLYLDPFKLNP